MIVKKMPILQGFPGFETVKKLTRNHVFSEHFAPLFYDIETTGLSRNSTFLYLYQFHGSKIFSAFIADCHISAC